MKIQHLFLVAIGSVMLSGCANQKEAMVESTTDQTQKRVHTRAELQKTGESEPGPALEKVDPAVQIDGRH